jgi:signal transduction histidine kinase
MDTQAVRPYQWSLLLSAVIVCAIWEYIDLSQMAQTSMSLRFLIHVGGTTLLLAIAVTAVSALIAQRQRAQQSQEQLTQQQTFVSSLLTAQENERRALAYDLHDGLTQYIIASHSHLETFQDVQKEGDGETAAGELEQGLRYLKEAVVEARRLINGLRSLALDDLGLVGALDQLLAEEKQRAQWGQADFVQNVGERRFDTTLETTVFRVAQEALTNARKHAQTSRVQVRLMATKDEAANLENLQLEVEDWGRGFAPEQQVRDYSHLGLQGMRERVHLLGGRYEMESTPGKGVLIRAVFSIPSPKSETVKGDDG